MEPVCRGVMMTETASGTVAYSYLTGSNKLSSLSSGASYGYDAAGNMTGDPLQPPPARRARAALALRATAVNPTSVDPPSVDSADVDKTPDGADQKAGRACDAQDIDRHRQVGQPLKLGTRECRGRCRHDQAHILENL